MREYISETCNSYTLIFQFFGARITFQENICQDFLTKYMYIFDEII